MLIGSHTSAPPPPFGTVFPYLYAPLTFSLVLGLSSRPTCSQDICSRSAVHASDTLTRSFTRYKFVTDQLTVLRWWLAEADAVEMWRQKLGDRSLPCTVSTGSQAPLVVNSLKYIPQWFVLFCDQCAMKVLHLSLNRLTKWTGKVGVRWYMPPPAVTSKPSAFCCSVIGRSYVISSQWELRLYSRPWVQPLDTVTSQYVTVIVDFIVH